MPNITCSALLPCTTEQEKQKHLKSDVHAVNHGIAFAELVSYIEEVRNDNLVAPVFKLADLVNLYSTRLKQLGTDVEGRVHSTKLKDRILCFFPDMEVHKQGDVVLISNKDFGLH